jgi:uncharacterized membrane protein YfcA
LDRRGSLRIVRATSRETTLSQPALALLNDLYLQGGRPFHDVPLGIVMAIAAIYFIAFTARGALGFGAIAPVVIITSLMIEPHHAVLLALIAGTLPQLQMLPEGIRDGDWQIARPVLATMIFAIPAGIWVFANMNTDWFTLVLGGTLSVLILADLTKLLERALRGVDLRAPLTASGLAMVTGFLNGLAGAGGVVTLAVYLKHACTDHISLRGTLVLIGTAMLCWRFTATGLAGLMTLKLVTEAVLLVPIVYLGVWLGTRYFRTVTPERYHRLLQMVILLSALGLVLKGIQRLV